MQKDASKSNQIISSAGRACGVCIIFVSFVFHDLFCSHTNKTGATWHDALCNLHHGGSSGYGTVSRIYNTKPQQILSIPCVIMGRWQIHTGCTMKALLTLFTCPTKDRRQRTLLSCLIDTATEDSAVSELLLPCILKPFGSNKGNFHCIKISAWVQDEKMSSSTNTDVNSCW